MPTETNPDLFGTNDLSKLAEYSEIHRVDLINIFQQTLRENLFSNRTEIRPRNLAVLAEQEAEALFSFLHNPDRFSGKEHGANLCRQGFSNQSVFGLIWAHWVFFQTVLKINGAELGFLSRYLYNLLEGFFEAREKQIQGEQESFRLAFQMALNRSNAEIQEARSTAQKAIESNYRNVILAQEEERRKISRELHDQAGQLLIGIYMSLENILKDASDEPLPKRERLQKALELADNATKDIKTLAHSLRPPVLDLLGINLTIKQLCLDFSEQTGLIINYSGIELPLIADELAITLYRVVQEALTNIVKHARAKHTRIKLDCAQDVIELLITDDGQGFDPLQKSNGMGLVGMQERVRLLNGELTINSSKGKFSKLKILLPLVLKPSSEGLPEY